MCKYQLRRKARVVGYIWDDYTVDTLIIHISRLHKIYLDEYKTIIETNFTTLKEHFELYSMMPIKVFFHIQGEDIRSGPWFLKYICKGKNSIENEVVYCDKDDIEFIHKQWSFKFRGKKLELNQCGTLSVSGFLGDNNNYLRLGERSELLALRNLVYSKINYEIDDVISALFRCYGLSHN